MANGTFFGDVITKWLAHPGEDRKMELQEQFGFTDSNGVDWIAEPGDVVDGASIPELVWNRIVGTPFVGDYRRASVVHDVAVKKKMRNSREAHRMFYEAMRADGVPEDRALIMYTAVRLFGPRWDSKDDSFELFAMSTDSHLHDQSPSISFDALEAALDQVIDQPS